MSWFGAYLGSGVTVRYDFGTTEKIKSFFSFILNIVEKILKKIHLDVKTLIINTNTIIICYKQIFIQWLFIQ